MTGEVFYKGAQAGSFRTGIMRVSQVVETAPLIKPRGRRRLTNRYLNRSPGFLILEYDRSESREGSSYGISESS